MRAKFLLISTISVLSLGLGLFSSNVRADDSVVNLSVLDSLSSDNSPNVNSGPLFPMVHSSQPMFPEVKKAPVKKVSKAQKVKKAAKKKLPTKKPVIAEKLQIPEKKDVLVDVEIPAAKKVDLPMNNGKYADSPFGVVHDEPIKVETAAAPIAPIDVKVEELPPVENKVTMEPLNGMTELPGGDDDDDAKEQMTPAVLDESSDILPSVATTPSVGESLFGMTDNQPSQTAVIENEPRPLVETAPVVPLLPAETLIPAVTISAPGNNIVFAAEMDELTDDNKKQIDAIIASFEDIHSNKIAIYAYNLNIGTDVFRRKRQSLNRAVAVRSYLLGQGYKNFSIKVVNITDDNGETDRVTIEELK